LQEAGVSVVAAANPLRGLTADAAYIASLVHQIPGPILLVGHSYGGAVITNAAAQTDNVVGLVYVAAVIPDEGEMVRELTGQMTERPALRAAQYPTGDGEELGIELYIDPTSFREELAADLPAEQAAVMAVSQRPAAQAVFTEPSGPPAWRRLPSWAVVARQDQAIEPSAARAMAERAGAAITEIDASHMILLSHPQAVADVILTAVAAVS
jgi:pimeloyl-ACP methyl ester carboxylesterase